MQATTNPTPTYLIVDDDRFSRGAIERSLNSFGDCTIYQAEDGQEAMDILAAAGKGIDIIVSDFSMPTMHGLELLKAIRTQQTAARHDVPFVMLTGKTDRLLAGVALSLDVDAFLTKPVRRRALELLLNRIAGVGASRRTMQPPDAYHPIDLAVCLGAVAVEFS